jgi:uncharacterized repeat protein (TIGR01451 family)
VSWICAGTGGGTCTAGGTGDISDTVDLPVNSSVTYTVFATVDPGASGSFSTTATVAVPSGLTDPASGNNSAIDTDTVRLAADLSSGMTDHACFVLPDSSITYTLQVENGGPNPAVGAIVSGHFPASLTGVSWTCTGSGGGTCGDPSGAGDISQNVDLPAGGTVTYTATATVPIGATGWLVATSAVTAPAGVVDAVAANNGGLDLDATEQPVFCSDLESGGTTDWSSTLP